jgi:hypothetical protein
VGEGAIRHEESARRPVLVSNVIDLAKDDLAIDAHTFVRAETQERAWTPATTFDGRKLPYGLGWFVQSHEGARLVDRERRLPLRYRKGLARAPDALAGRSPEGGPQIASNGAGDAA